MFSRDPATLTNLSAMVPDRGRTLLLFALAIAFVAYATLAAPNLVISRAALAIGGTLVLTARRHRTQEANRQDARTRLAEMLAEAEKREARRVKTKPSKAAKARRVDEKKGRSAVKAGRGKVKLD